MTGSRKILTVTFALFATTALAACQTTAPGQDVRSQKINTLMEEAATTADKDGYTRESLSVLENLYKRNSDDPQAALKYARALRHAGYYNRASLILGPFATDADNKNADIAIEYASIQAAMGSYLESETAARKAVLLAPASGKAYHVLGIALDAQGHHEQAQNAFEKGLDHWEGDPSPILNNMGLNLAAQGFLDEALETLRKALATAPDRTEIERNLRIVSALQYQPPKSGVRLVPAPPRKPDPDAVKNEAGDDIELKEDREDEY